MERGGKTHGRSPPLPRGNLLAPVPHVSLRVVQLHVEILLVVAVQGEEQTVAYTLGGNSGARGQTK